MSNPGPSISVTDHPQVWTSNQSLRLLASLKGMSLSQIQEVKVPIINSAKWYPLYLVLTNASLDFTAIGAAISVYTGPNATGDRIFGSTPLAVHTSSRYVSQITSNTISGATVSELVNNVFIRSDNNTGIANATIDAFIYGFDLYFLP